jgi:aryl-alcohol dehydrogenase-like predicted oxidoreductase
MEYRKLGQTGLDVSAICLGTMTWGEQNTEAEAHQQMDYALDQGVNFFDAAELYPIPPKPKTQGRTEKHIGNWFASRNKRDKVIIATKVNGRSNSDWFRDDGSGCRLSPEHINEAVEKSLKRLRTDYIDLYQLHWPDRPMQLFGDLEYKHDEGEHHPIEETLEAVAKLIEQGKVRYVGISNETAWGTMSYLEASKSNGLPRPASIQNAFNLVNRSFEVDLSEISHRENIGLLAYSPLGQGTLTGKYLNGARPPGSRKVLFDRVGRYETPSAEKAIGAYVALADEHALDPAQMALQFVTTRPFVTSSIIGATSMAQLQTNIKSVDVKLSDDVLTGIEEIHRTYTNPCP